MLESHFENRFLKARLSMMIFISDIGAVGLISAPWGQIRNFLDSDLAKNGFLFATA